MAYCFRFFRLIVTIAIASCLRDNFNLLADAHHHYHRPLHRNLLFDVETLRHTFGECSDVTQDLFPAPSFDILDDVFDCECIGDLNVSFVMSCKRENYCFFPLANDSIINNSEYEVCVSSVWNYTVDPIIDTNRSYHPWTPEIVLCDTFAKGGPVSGPICLYVNSSCAAELEVVHGLDAKNASQICTRLDEECFSQFLALGYSLQDAQNFCPVRTLNDKSCKTAGFEDCTPPNNMEATNDENIVYLWTPDCSNVEPCATPMCREFEQDSVSFLPLYPECGGRNAVDNGTSTNMSGVSKTSFLPVVVFFFVLSLWLSL